MGLGSLVSVKIMEFVLFMSAMLFHCYITDYSVLCKTDIYISTFSISNKAFSIPVHACFEYKSCCSVKYLRVALQVHRE